MAQVTGTFTSTGTSTELQLEGTYDLSIQGPFIGTVETQRSFDQGVTWVTDMVFRKPFVGIGEIAKFGNRLRLQCTAYTSGTITYYFGQ